MIEIEVYAAGVRTPKVLTALTRELEAIPSLHFKVDSNHDLVYLDFDEPTVTIVDIRKIFRKVGLDPRVVGAVPADLNPKSKTRPLTL